MKKNCLSALFGILLCSAISAQSRLITIDVRALDLPALEKALEAKKQGQMVALQLQNINTILYKVEISAGQIVYPTNMPVELATLFRITQESTANLEKAKNEAGAAVENMKALESVTKDTALQKALPGIIEKCEDYVKKTGEVIEIFNKVKANMTVFLSGMRPAISQTDFQNALSGLESLVTSGNRRICDEYCTLYNEVEALYENALLPNLASKEKKRVEDALEKIEEAHEVIEGRNISGLLDEIETLNKAADDPKNFTITSTPIQMEGDAVEFKIKQTPKDPKVASEITWAPLTVPVKGGWKTDFSVGPAFSFGKESLDEKYYLENLSDTTAALRGNDNNNSIRPGLAAMMHFYPRTGRYDAYGFMFGVGAGFQSIDDVNLSFFGGGSILLGKERKVILSGGISYLRLDRLKTPQYEKDAVYPVKPIDLDDVTEKVFRPSFFLSISYAIASKVEIK